MWFHKQWPELCLKTSLYHVMEIKRENGSHCRMCTRGKILILFTQLHLQFTNKIFGWRVIEKCSFKDLYSFIPLHTYTHTTVPPWWVKSKCGWETQETEFLHQPCPGTQPRSSWTQVELGRLVTSFLGPGTGAPTCNHAVIWIQYNSLESLFTTHSSLQRWSDNKNLAFQILFDAVIASGNCPTVFLLWPFVKCSFIR